MNANPRVSVILPVYNGAAFLDEVIPSVLGQTFADFEFIIIDDGSTDSSAEIIGRYRDDRIRLVKQSNRGLATTLNIGIGLSRGQYIARQDQDDIMRPERLARQVAFLDFHRDCCLVGTWTDVVMGGGRKTHHTYRPPVEDAKLRFELVFDSPFVHSSVMMRKRVVEHVGGYATAANRQPPEDYELWSRLQRVGVLANIPEALQVYRHVEGSMTATGKVKIDTVVDIGTENIQFLLGKSSASAQRDLLALYHSAWHRLSSRPSLIRVAWQLCRLVRLEVRMFPTGVAWFISRAVKILLILLAHYGRYRLSKSY